jgi:phosphatidylinositol alpha-mannosyltransferase
VKIALVSPYDWSYPGGVRSHIEHLAHELRRRGHVVHILTPASGPARLKAETGVHKLAWATPFRINGSVARVSITPSLSGKLRRLLTRENFDVVHLHEPFVSMLTLEVLHILRATPTTCVATFHASSNRRASAPVMAYAMAKPFLQSAFARLDGWIAVSEAARAHVARFFSADFAIIPNGIDLTQYDGTLPALPAFADGKRNVVFLSRMESRKGLRYLLKAIPLVRDSYHGPHTRPVRFILAGDGPQRERFERFVQKKGWEDVVFTGYVSEEMKRALLAQADVYCAPNTGNESQGIILLEAMASGTPVVASDIPGFRTVITNPEMGILTQPRNAERLAWAICHLLRDDETRQRIGLHGRMRAEEYSWGRVATSIQQVYSDSRRRTLERSRGHQVFGLPVGAALFGTPFDEQRATPSVTTISPFEENVVE